MFAIFNEEERYEIFLDKENAEKCLCTKYENDSDYSINEIKSDEQLTTSDELFDDIPYKVYAVKLDGEIVAAFSEKYDAKDYQSTYYENEKERIIEDWGLDKDDMSPKRVAEVEMEIGNLKVKKYKPEDDENYRDCLDILDKTFAEDEVNFFF